MKKRAPKKTKIINYRQAILKQVFDKPGCSKDEICKSIVGYRNAIFRDINELINEGKIKEADVGGLIVSIESDVEKKHDLLVNQLTQFREIRDNTITRIKEGIEKSPTKSFFYQTEHTYTSPLAGHEGELAGPEFETVKIYHINDEAKDWIFLIPHLIDQLVRRAFSLYTSQMLSSIPDETYKRTFEPAIKQVSEEVEKTKEMLLAMVDKKDKKYFEGWWWQLTVGLELDDEPYPNPETDVRWTGKKI